MIARLSFIGREQELGILGQALEVARSGAGSLVLVSGDPGIGKTRFCNEAKVIAGRGQFQVVTGQCREMAGSPAYWPWIQVLNNLDVPAALDADFAKTRGAIEAPISSVSSRAANDSSNLSEFRVHELTSDLLVSTSLQQPLLVLLEDLHWSDRASLRLLEYLSPALGNSQLVVICTFRERGLEKPHPLSETLGELRRYETTRDIPLNEFEEGEIAQLVTEATGYEPSESLLNLVTDRTGGNALYATELLRMLEEDNLLQDGAPLAEPGRVIGVPRSIRSTLTRRISALPDSTIQVLDAASVIGREFDLKLLAALSDATPIQALEHLEPALRTALVEPDEANPARHRFSHALIWQAVYEELSAAKRMQLHADAVKVIENEGASNAIANASTLAFHSKVAEPVLGEEPAIKWSLLHGEQLIRNRAYEDAFDVFQAVLKRLAPGVHEQLDDIPMKTGWPVDDISRFEARLLNRDLQTARALKGYARCWNAKRQ